MTIIIPDPIKANLHHHVNTNFRKICRSIHPPPEGGGLLDNRLLPSEACQNDEFHKFLHACRVYNTPDIRSQQAACNYYHVIYSVINSCSVLLHLALSRVYHTLTTQSSPEKQQHTQDHRLMTNDNRLMQMLRAMRDSIENDAKPYFLLAIGQGCRRLVGGSVFASRYARLLRRDKLDVWYSHAPRRGEEPWGGSESITHSATAPGNTPAVSALRMPAVLKKRGSSPASEVIQARHIPI